MDKNEGVAMTDDKSIEPLKDEVDIKLRDQLAMAAMQALIAKYKVFDGYIQALDSYREEDGYNPRKTKPTKSRRIATVAYIIADEMRKVRLKAVE